jgi:hypothetical protein
MFESLESRRLLSVSVTFADGSKVVQGGGGLNVTSGSSGDSNLAIVENLNGVSGDHNIDVFNNNTFEHAYFSGVYGTIHYSGGSRTDRVVINMTTLNADVSGGEGDDVITIRNTSANGGDKVDAGGGNDRIILVASASSTLNGGGGDDIFDINTGSIAHTVLFDYEGSNTVINGGGGNDIFNIYDGNAKINGAGGDDILIDWSAGSATYTTKNVETEISGV